MSARAGRRAGVLPARVGILGLAGLLGLVGLLGFGGLAAPVVHAEEHEIVITDTGFDPDTLTVFVGEPVTWTNETATEHAILTADGLLDSGPIGPGEAFGHVFEAPGSVEYYEAGNPRVIGTIVVREAPATAPPSGSPEPTPPPGTLPPDFSPVAPSEPPTPAASSLASATPSIAAEPVVVAVPAGGGNGPALFLAVAVVGAIAVIAAIVGLIGASRRPGR
jgi:plastocyanin